MLLLTHHMSELQDVFETPSQSQKRTRRYILIFIFILLLIIIAVGAYQYLSASTSNQKQIKVVTQPTPLPTEAPTPTSDASPTAQLSRVKNTPSPTPKASITPTKGTPTPSPKQSVNSATTTSRSKLTVAVQNGTGVAGAAKKAADMLTTLGYTVSSTGNADAFTYEETVIRIKPSKTTYLQTLKTDVSESYIVGSATSDLPESAATDAVVIVGK